MPWDLRDADPSVQRVIHAVADMRVPMAKAETIIAKAIDDNFAGEWDGTTHWKQLDPATVKDRERKGYGGAHPILQRTGDLRNSMKGSHDGESAEVGPSEDIEYAKYHEEGTIATRHAKSTVEGVPPRPFLRISAADADAIEAEIWKYLEDTTG